MSVNATTTVSTASSARSSSSVSIGFSRCRRSRPGAGSPSSPTLRALQVRRRLVHLSLEAALEVRDLVVAHRELLLRRQNETMPAGDGEVGDGDDVEERDAVD